MVRDRRIKIPRSALLRRRRRARTVRSRRMFVLQGLALLGGGLTLWAQRPEQRQQRAGVEGSPPIRPPTASQDDARFRDACIRCGMCGTVCENGCIRFLGLQEAAHGALTPYLDVRRRSCTLCMRCTQVCPTGALSHVQDEPKAIAKTVRMGLAVVDPDRCISYQGRLCGNCHDACPLPGTAIRLSSQAKPVVLTDGCVGCGRCVESCPQQPTAIDVFRGLS